MRSYDQLGARGRVARLRHLARAALPAFDLGPDPLPLVADHENVTFRHGRRGPQAVAVRVHRPGYHEVEALRCEGAWLRALGRDLPGRVPRALVTAAGDTVVLASAPGRVPEPRAVSASAWLPGRHGAERTPAWAAAVGALTADLHAHAAAWRRPSPWRRPRWDGHALTGPGANTWAPPESLPGLTAAEQDRVRGLNADLAAEIGRWPVDPEHLGLIHADLHLHNVHLVGKGPKVQALALDFDDCGEGFWWYDAAVSVLPSAQAQVGLEALVAWLAAYAARRPLPPEGRARLPLLWLARRFLMTSWFTVRVAEPAHGPHLPRVLAGLRATLEAWGRGDWRRLAASAFGG